MEDSDANWSFEGPATHRGDPDIIRLHEEHQRQEESRRQIYQQDYLPRHPKSLSGIALRAFCLGIAAAVSLTIAAALLIFTSSPAWRVLFFIGSLATFHFLEFWCTAEANTSIATTESFLLTSNWPHYAIAHSVATCEGLLVALIFPDRDWSPFGLGPVLLTIGLALTAIGQITRSMAMIHAAGNFNHEIQWRKSDSHVLVTTGIYSIMRHPSYFGFFYWGLGTQLVMGNVLSFFIYAGVIWWFFSRRISYEEIMLVAFFKDDYRDYRKRVGTWIPFIR